MLKITNLQEIDKAIYWICNDNPKTIYQILAELSFEGIEISYSNCNQKCGVLMAKGFLSRIQSTSRKIMYKSIVIPTKTEKESEDA